MEIRNLTTFVSVAELNSFTRAAQALGYSQSTVSFQIRQLEEELGRPLFERINHTISLTEAGAETLAFAQQMVHLSEEFCQRIQTPQALGGRIHVVTPDSVCESMITRNYADFHRRYPGISLKFTTADTVEMFRMLDHNEADLVLTLDSHAYRSDYVIIKEEPVQMHFVASAQSDLPHRPLTPQELLAQPLILTERGMGYRRALDEALAGLSLESRPMLEIGRTDLICALLEKGVGVSYLPEFVTRRAHAEGRLRYLDVPDLKCSIWQQLICHRNKWRTRSLEALIGYICSAEFCDPA